MAEAAEAEVTSSSSEGPALTEAGEAQQASVVDSFTEEAELPDFDIYTDEEPSEEPETKATDKSEEVKPKESGSWSARVRKDRQLRQKEIEFKRREQAIAGKESQVRAAQNMRQAILDDPSEFFKSQGIDPLDFYSDWTNRIATGSTEASPDLRLSTAEKELKDLKNELRRRDESQRKRVAEAHSDREVQEYYGKIDQFLDTTSDFPLTKQQCSSSDVAQGIAAYYRETGVELGFKEACTMVEDGLRKQENDVFTNPAIIAKFKEFHGLDASKKGKRAQLTLSNNLRAPPTRVPSEDMTEEEIYDFWKGKLFTD